MGYLKISEVWRNKRTGSKARLERYYASINLDLPAGEDRDCAVVLWLIGQGKRKYMWMDELIRLYDPIPDIPTEQWIQYQRCSDEFANDGYMCGGCLKGQFYCDIFKKLKERKDG